MHVFTYDRRGWGETGEPLGYSRTTVNEHSGDLEFLLEGHESVRRGRPVMLCGAGFGAVVALDLALRAPGLVGGLLLVEPPLLATLREATELISADMATIESLAQEGVGGIVDAFYGGMLPGLAAGGERIPDRFRERTSVRPGSLIAELGVVSHWQIPLAAMRDNQIPSAVVCCTSTPDLLRRAAAQLVPRLGGAVLHDLEAGGLPEAEGAAEIAELAAEMA